MKEPISRLAGSDWLINPSLLSRWYSPANSVQPHRFANRTWRAKRWPGCVTRWPCLLPREESRSSYLSGANHGAGGTPGQTPGLCVDSAAVRYWGLAQRGTFVPCALAQLVLCVVPVGSNCERNSAILTEARDLLTGSARRYHHES